jgi:hypothetical protein
MIAEIVKREVELQRLKEREIGWTRAKRRASRRRKAISLDSETESASEESELSEDDRPSRRLAPRSRKARNVLPDPRDVQAAPADFFDQLMVRNGKFNPWG